MKIKDYDLNSWDRILLSQVVNGSPIPHIVCLSHLEYLGLVGVDIKTNKGFLTLLGRAWLDDQSKRPAREIVPKRTRKPTLP